MFYHHPRDLWIEKQVGLMKKHRVGYGEGFRLMEREYQKQLYVSQLERQHQLQQVAVSGSGRREVGACVLKCLFACRNWEAAQSSTIAHGLIIGWSKRPPSAAEMPTK